MVNLVERGWADLNDVARAFGYSARTVRRNQERLDAGGLSALGQPRGYPKGRRRGSQARVRSIERLKTEGHSNCEIARRLASSEKVVRKSLRRLGWKNAPTAQGTLPLR
jgi:transposase